MGRASLRTPLSRRVIFSTPAPAPPPGGGGSDEPMEDADRDEEEIAETPAVRGEEEIAKTPAVRGRFPPLEEEDGSTCVIMSCVESGRLCGYLPYL